MLKRLSIFMIIQRLLVITIHNQWRWWSYGEWWGCGINTLEFDDNYGGSTIFNVGSKRFGDVDLGCSLVSKFAIDVNFATVEDVSIIDVVDDGARVSAMLGEHTNEVISHVHSIGHEDKAFRVSKVEDTSFPFPICNVIRLPISMNKMRFPMLRTLLKTPQSLFTFLFWPNTILLIQLMKSCARFARKST